MTSSQSLCLIMPAYRRYALSEITFEQRRRMIDELRATGMRVDCVVIADDENLDIAEEHGFVRLVQDNEFLGRRFNDGHEFACKEGFSHAAPVGSDMFIDPVVFKKLTDQFVTTQDYAVVDKKGTSLLKMKIEWGVLQIVPTRFFKGHPLWGRPCVEEVKKGCDSLTRTRVMAHNKNVKLTFQNHHDYECVSFQSKTQITSFTKLGEVGGTTLHSKAINEVRLELEQFYPSDLLDQIVHYYASGMSLKA